MAGNLPFLAYLTETLYDADTNQILTTQQPLLAEGQVCNLEYGVCSNNPTHLDAVINQLRQDLAAWPYANEFRTYFRRIAAGLTPESKGWLNIDGGEPGIQPRKYKRIDELRVFSDEQKRLTGFQALHDRIKAIIDANPNLHGKLLPLVVPQTPRRRGAPQTPRPQFTPMPQTPRPQFTPQTPQLFQLNTIPKPLQFIMPQPIQPQPIQPQPIRLLPQTPRPAVPQTPRPKKVCRRKQRILPDVRMKVWTFYTQLPYEDRAQGWCFACDDPLLCKNYKCGHILSEAHGGQITQDNLRPVCVSCNERMGRMHMFEFILMNHFSGRSFLTNPEWAAYPQFLHAIEEARFYLGSLRAAERITQQEFDKYNKLLDPHLQTNKQRLEVIANIKQTYMDILRHRMTQ